MNILKVINNDKPLWAVKALMSLYIIQNFALTDLGMYVPRLSIMLLMSSLFITILTPSLRLSITRCKALQCSLAFILYSVLFGLAIARDSSILIHFATIYFESLIAGYVFICCIYRGGSVDFIAFSFAVASLLVARYMINYSEEFIVKSRMSVNETVNANSVAVMLGFGCWGIGWLASRIKWSLVSFLIMLGGSVMLLWAEFLTGSRKGLISIVFVVTSWLFINFRGQIKQMNVLKKVVIIAFAMAAVIWSFVRYGATLIDRSSIVLARMEYLEADMGEGGWKFGMIADAFKVWEEHPIIGVGFNNYRYYSSYGKYAHNTYAEVFASTGIIGAVLLGAMFFYIIYWHFKARRSLTRILLKRDEIFYSFVLLLAFLFICFGQICFYNERLMCIFNTLIGISLVYENNIKYGKYRIGKTTPVPSGVA